MQAALAKTQRLSAMSFVALDLETTGLDPERDRIVEVAAVRYDAGRETACLHAIVDPGIPIPVESAVIHQLTDDLVAGHPRWEQTRERVRRFIGDLPVVAHRSSFDAAFARLDGEQTWICTWRLARQLWDAPRYTLQHLRFWLRLMAASERLAPHTALDDARIAGQLFLRELSEFEVRRSDAALEDLLELERAPITSNRMPMRGAYAGVHISEVPSAYLQNALADTARPLEFQDLRLDLATVQAIREEVRARADLPSRLS